MKLYVLNSANMPTDAIYRKMQITEEEFIHLIKNNDIHSCVGYDSVCKHIFTITGVTVTKNRELTVLEEDTGYIAVVKLKFRMEPSKKGHYVPTRDDYEYHLVFFNKNFKITI